MNIKFYTAGADYPNYHSLAASTDKQAPVAAKTAGNYDKVTIRKRPDAADDSSFAQMLARKLTDRLAEGDNQEKVRRLQQEVASRTYEPDARRIAERMLGYH